MALLTCDYRNNGAQTVDTIRMHAFARSEGRAVEWSKERVDFAVPGGIEPGETVREVVYLTKPLPERAAGFDVRYDIEVWQVLGADGSILESAE